MRPFIPSPIEYGYRNRITVHVRDGVIGFFRRESNKLLSIERCPIARDEVNAKLADLRGSNPHDGHYTLRVIDGPRVFTQANDGVAAAMLDLVDRLLASAGGTLIDAYCGAGFFAKRLRARFERVIGIDWDQRAIAVAREDANENETYVAADVETELSAAQRAASERRLFGPPAWKPPVLDCRPAGDRAEQGACRNTNGISADAADLRFLQSGDARPRPGCVEKIVSYRFNYAAGYVSADCGSGSRG